jgi:hypothetical protein
MNAVLNSYEVFLKNSSITNLWPIEENSLELFTTWCLVNKKLKPASVLGYVSSLIVMNKLKGHKNLQCISFNVKMMIRGAENLKFYSKIGCETRVVMTIDLLRLLGLEISNSGWSTDSQQVFWSASCLAFFGSFRLGEILSPSENNFNPVDTLLWNDIEFSKNSALVHIKVPKNRNAKGEYVDIFRFEKYGCCPLAALEKLKSIRNSSAENEPVFKFSSGKLLTQSSMNTCLKVLLKPHLGGEAGFVSGHSFRAAIPSALACHPNIARCEDIKQWGRWSSDSYLLYTRLKLQQKKCIFDTITSVL